MVDVGLDVDDARDRHCGADPAFGRVDGPGDVLSLEVSDDGRGLSDADLAKARSFGIRGLHELASPA